MYDAEDIRDAHDIPNAYIKALGQPICERGVEVTPFYCVDGGDRFVITACELPEGASSTRRHELKEVMEAGQGDFLEGLLAVISQHAKDPTNAGYVPG